MTQHTEGPWQVRLTQSGHIARQRIDDSRYIDGPDGLAVAFAADYNSEERDAEIDANARLIAAAPDLLAALEGLFPLLDFVSQQYRGDYDVEIAAADAAIAKAQRGVRKGGRYGN